MTGGPAETQASAGGKQAAWAALPLVVAFVATSRVRLNGDVDYALGTIETAGRGGVGVGDVFGARPFAYRLLILGLDRLRGLVDDGPGSSRTDDLVIRVLAAVVVAGVGLVLWRGLRRHADPVLAGAVALAVAASLAVAPPWHFLEPDWAAVLCAVLGVGLALLPRRTWLGASVGGAALALAVAMKLVTFPWALIGLVAIALVARRRAVATATAWVALLGAWMLLTAALQPWEVTWLRDQAAIVSGSPLHRGIHLGDLLSLGHAVANVVIVSPILVAVPAAATVLVRRRRGRSRVQAILVLVLVAGLCLASGFAQGEYFQYHFAGVPVVGAAIWAAAVAAPTRARTALLVMPLPAALASALLLSRPLRWRLDNVAAALGIQLAIAAVGLVWAARASRPSSPGEEASDLRGATALALGVAAAAALVAPLLPHSTYSFDVSNARAPAGSSIHSVLSAERAYERLRADIGRDSRVTYLTYGSVNRQLGNPTTCRYPSPQWLQRSIDDPSVGSLVSYRDNLRCLRDDGGARFLVWQPGWFELSRAPAEIRDVLARFDCRVPARITPAPPGLVVCPRRSGA